MSRMAVEIFRHRMHNDVETEGQRSLHVGRGEGVVGHARNASFARQCRHRRQVGQLEQRIRRAFDPDHARIRPDRGTKRIQVRRIDKTEIQIRRAPPHPLEEAEGAAVDVVAHQHVRAVVE